MINEIINNNEWVKTIRLSNGDFMKKAFAILSFLAISSGALANVTVTELAIRTEGEIINGKPFRTVHYENGVLIEGKLGDKYVVASGSCSITGMSVGFHKTGDCDQNFAMVTCQDEKFDSTIKLTQSVISYVDGQISISEYPTGFWAPNKCKVPAASITVK